MIFIWKVSQLSFRAPGKTSCKMLKTLKEICVQVKEKVKELFFRSLVETLFSVLVGSNGALCTSQREFPGPTPPPAGNPWDSDRVYLTHTGESDSLIVTHSGDIWQKHFNTGEFWPQLERIVAIFLAFFIYFLSIPTHSPRDFLTGNSLSLSFTCSSSCICLKAHVFDILHPSKGILT